MNIIEILETLRKGKCITEATNGLQEVVKTCRDTGKKGKLTIAIEVAPDAEGQVIISADLSSKLPKANIRGNIFYDDEDGHLFREDPNQPELPAIAKMKDAVNE